MEPNSEGVSAASRLDATAPPHLEIMRKEADRVLSACVHPRYHDSLSSIYTLRSMLRVMIDILTLEGGGTSDPGYTGNRLVEARRALTRSPGAGLQSAEDTAKVLAELLVDLIDIYQEATAE